MAAHPEQQQSPRQKQKHMHFLVATFPLQGHINPALNLAKRLALAAGPSASVTFSTTTAAHRRMFPSASSRSDDDILHNDGLLTYAPFSDGHDHGWNGGIPDFNRYMSEFEQHGSRHLSDLVGNFAARAAQSPASSTPLSYRGSPMWRASTGSPPPSTGSNPPPSSPYTTTTSTDTTA
uniref:Uncharacterized protein n=1 Tax=Ananas comosus var. bracteatus TaxID=296719 RepID=A0A6V7QQ62_ANACO